MAFREKTEDEGIFDRHLNNNEKLFDIGKLVLVFQTKMGSMPRKLRFRWTGPFRIVNTYNSMCQLGTLAGEVLPMGKWLST